MVTLTILLAVVAGGVLLWMLHTSSAWRKTSKSGARLPKGCMGWPMLGETIELGLHPVNFALSRFRRYGNIFKSSIFGTPTILAATSDFTRFVISNQDAFQSGYTSNIKSLLGSRAFLFQDGPRHAAIRMLLTKAVLPESLRSQVGEFDVRILRHLASWGDKGSIVSFEGTKEITLDLAFHLVVGPRDEHTEARRVAKQNFKLLSAAVIAIPVNVPGTAFSAGIKARKDLTTYFKKLIRDRKDEVHTETDILGVFLAARANPDPSVREEVKNMDDDDVADNMVNMVFGAFDTSSATLVWILKYLLDNPDVFQALRAEHEEILNSKDPKDAKLTWEDIKKMVYTTKFYYEVHRHASVVVAVFRKATRDVEYKGVLLPKNWSIMLMLTALHRNPEYFPNPSKFDPSRFDKPPKPFTFMPFSSGVHMCPGKEVAKLMAQIFIHHMVTKFKYETTSCDDRVTFACLPIPKGGYPINIQRKTD